MSFRPCPPPAKVLKGNLPRRIEDEDLCNCVFTLAYGPLTLLHDTPLCLKRGNNYGLLGPSGCGKSTLLRAIHNMQVCKFLPTLRAPGYPATLRTALVDPGFGEALPESEWSPVDYLLDEVFIQMMHGAGNLSEKQMLAELTKVGIWGKDKLCWLSEIFMVKLGLVRAKLMEADILMLEEPTSYLNMPEAQWVIDYINSLKTGPKPVTVIATSHDPQYLESTMTDILRFQGHHKLEHTVYKGGIVDIVDVSEGPSRRRKRIVGWD